MAQNKTLKWIEENKTAILTLGTLILVGYSVFKVKNTISKAFKRDEKSTKITGTGGGLNKKNTTINEHTATNLASQLLLAMDRYGTDEELISEVFDQIRSKDDFLMVYRAFGKKIHNGFGTPLIPILDTSEEYDLVYWLNEELDRSSDRKLRQKIGPVIRQAGFAFN